MRAFASTLVLLLASLLFAETQQQLYMQAMLAEEAGQVSESIDLFEQALAAGGEYSEEIREILEGYYDALGISKDSSSRLEYRFLANVGFYGLHYAEYGSNQDVSENGGDLFASVSGFIDYNVGDWIHSFGAAFVSDWFVANDDMPVLDTNDWTLAPGIEYSLVGRRILLDVGIDFNITSEGDFNPAVYGWGEYDILHYEKQRVGAALWGYYRNEGPSSLGLYATWHRTESFGLNGSAYLGVKYEADYLVDILSYVEQFADECKQYNEWGVCTDPDYDYTKEFTRNWEQCVADHGEELCRDSRNGLLESYMNAEEEYEVTKYWSRWIGPAFNAKISYRFKNKIEVEGKMNLFYAFLIDGASAEYEQMGKFSATWGFMGSWNPNWLTLYFGIEQLYLDYSLPSSLEEYLPDCSLLTSLKAGMKVDF